MASHTAGHVTYPYVNCFSSQDALFVVMDSNAVVHAEDDGSASSRFYEAEQKLSDLEKEKLDIDRYLGGTLDYGPNNIFLPLAGLCFSSYQTRWTYEACFYGEASQSEGYTNKVNIGHFKGFDHNYSEMVFGDGDMCHGVGPRTFRVKLVCGPAEVLKDAEEPATCQYAATLTTPLLCSEADLAAAEDRLASLEAQEAEIRRQIEAMEKDEL